MISTHMLFSNKLGHFYLIVSPSWFLQNTYHFDFVDVYSTLPQLSSLLSLLEKQYTQAIQHMTQNQLTIYIDPVFVDVRFNSEMPSTMPSTFPSSQPSEMPTSAPTVITSPPSRGSDTSTIIVAVVVPVTVVLLIAFAGICYVTREAVQRNDSDESVEDVIPIPAQHDPGWSPPPGGTLPGSVMSGQAPEEIHPLHRHSGGSASHGHPEVVSRHPSHTSAISELSAVDTERRRFQGTPGFMSPTGTFTPSLAPLAP